MSGLFTTSVTTNIHKSLNALFINAIIFRAGKLHGFAQRTQMRRDN